MAPEADITIDGLGNVNQSSELNDEVSMTAQCRCT